MQVSAVEASQRTEHAEGRLEHLSAREADTRGHTIWLEPQSIRLHSQGIRAPADPVSGRSGHPGDANVASTRIPDPGIGVMGACERLSQRSLLEWRVRSRSSATGPSPGLHWPLALASRARDARRDGSAFRRHGLSPCRRAGSRSDRARRPSAPLRCDWPRRPCDRCSSGGTSPSAPPPRAPCRSRCSRVRARAR